MNAGFNDILKRFETSENFKRLESLIAQKEEIKLNGLVGSGLSFIAAALFQQRKQHTVVVVNDKEEAAYLLTDLETLLNRKVLFYPSSYRRPYQLEETDNANVLLRTEVLNSLNHQNLPIIVSYPEAIFEKVISQEQLKNNSFDGNITKIFEIELEVSFIYKKQIIFFKILIFYI